jgi:hypothetical protein
MSSRAAAGSASPGRSGPCIRRSERWRGVPAFVGRGAARGTRRGLHRGEPQGERRGLRILSERGAGGAVCFASGFRESVPRRAMAKRWRRRWWRRRADAHPRPELLRVPQPPRRCGRSGPISTARCGPSAAWRIVTQSSNIALNLTMQARGLPLAYVVTVGNQAQTGMPRSPRGFWRTIASRRWACISRAMGDVAAFEAMAASGSGDGQAGRRAEIRSVGGRAGGGRVAHGRPCRKRCGRARFRAAGHGAGPHPGGDAGDAEDAACRGAAALRADRVDVEFRR